MENIMNTVKNKLNIIGRTFVKKNQVGGDILSFIPEIPISGNLNDFLFILTIPNDDQKFAPAYVRLQDKSRTNPDIKQEEMEEFTQVRSACFLQHKRGDILVCAPTQKVFVDFSKLVFIATIPAEGKRMAPCYFRVKKYDKNKNELQEEVIVEEDTEEERLDQVDMLMKEAQMTEAVEEMPF